MSWMPARGTGGGVQKLDGLRRVFLRELFRYTAAQPPNQLFEYSSRTHFFDQFQGNAVYVGNADLRHATEINRALS
jgi:hypothetical protein